MTPTVESLAVAFRAARDLFLPRTCALCREPVPQGIPGRLCTGCLFGLEDQAVAPGDACPVCALPKTPTSERSERGGGARREQPEAEGRGWGSGGEAPGNHEGRPRADRPGRRCRRCPKGRLVSAMATFGPFEGTLRDAVHVFKFEGDPGLGDPLGALVARAARRLPADADVVVPVPLHLSRLLVRGFNQSAVLARKVARALGKPLALDALTRTRASPEQSGSTRSERRANVRGAFAAKHRRVAGKRVLLVDDVLTTGATAQACAAALQNAGATRVYVVALARARAGA